MIGFVVTQQTAQAILAKIAQAQINDYGKSYWSTGSYEILSGEHAGKYFILFDDTIINTVLRNGMKPMDFPEFEKLSNALGGLEARVEISPSDLLDGSDLSDGGI